MKELNKISKKSCFYSLGLAILLVSSGTTSPANAQTNIKASQVEPPSFATLDSDNSGGISEEELYTFRAARITRRAHEGRMMRNADKAPLFEDIDSDSNGTISSDEFAVQQKLHSQRQNTGHKIRGRGMQNR